jgi:uncharacterized membrane protein YgaE (UPF0421/DUF939 family)
MESYSTAHNLQKLDSFQQQLNSLMDEFSELDKQIDWQKQTSTALENIRANHKNSKNIAKQNKFSHKGFQYR